MNLELLKKFWNEEDAQTTTEYVLILFLVVIIIKKFQGEFLGFLEGLIGKLKTEATDITDQ